MILDWRRVKRKTSKNSASSNQTKFDLKKPVYYHGDIILSRRRVSYILRSVAINLTGSNLLFKNCLQLIAQNILR